MIDDLSAGLPPVEHTDLSETFGAGWHGMQPSDPMQVIARAAMSLAGVSDPAILARALERALGDPEARAQFMAAGRETARAESMITYLDAQRRLRARLPHADADELVKVLKQTGMDANITPTGQVAQGSGFTLQVNLGDPGGPKQVVEVVSDDPLGIAGLPLAGVVPGPRPG